MLKITSLLCNQRKFKAKLSFKRSVENTSYDCLITSNVGTFLDFDLKLNQYGSNDSPSNQRTQQKTLLKTKKEKKKVFLFQEKNYLFSTGSWVLLENDFFEKKFFFTSFYVSLFFGLSLKQLGKKSRPNWNKKGKID